MRKDELKYELPDYITGELKNEKIIGEIEDLLKSDLEFMEEYEDLFSTFNFLKDAEIKSPSEDYFSNLSVKINEKLSAKKKAFSSNSLKYLWKYLLPAAAVIIIGIFIYPYFNDQSVEREIALKNDLVKKESLTVEDKSGKIESASPEQNKLNDQNENSSGEEFTSTQPVRKNKIIHKQSSVQSEENVSTEESQTLTDYELILDVDENYNLEDEFEDLSVEQQKEILENLSKASI